AIHSVVGLILVWFGGFRLFERLMAVCIGVMFVTVMVTAALIRPDWAAVAGGLAIPTIPEGGLGYALGVLGGVGGTVTLMSYGYWVREKGRRGARGLRDSRIDLAVGYVMTALFGTAMIIIGSRLVLDRGPTIALELAGQLESAVGPAGRWIFLVGFWGAVFSSLLGVWQSVPYLFADFVLLNRSAVTSPREIDFTRSRPYRVYLVLIATVPLPLLWLSLERAQLTYAVLGSWFMPLLAFTLLWMNNRTTWVGRSFRNGPIANAALVLTLLFFGYAATRTLLSSLNG
ncbi:MAG: Nramp family divalent metal transporter, partial [Acidobacteriota bacterium]|nr:Nramp family divalent metal transporter [Acidobacteriota bacterium]